MEIPYCPHTPATHQERWLSRREHSYTYFCGRGGGKSEALLMAALQDIAVPGYRAVMFFRSTESMRYWQDYLDRWWEDDSHLSYHSTGNWAFPGGAMLQLRVFPTAGKAERYRATAFDFMSFDNIETYTTQDLQVSHFLSSRVRGPGSRVRAAYEADWNVDALQVRNPYIDV